MRNQLRKITRADIQVNDPLIAVYMPYPQFVDKFGPMHEDHPPQWDAPGPVELWFFELPWGHKITLEYHLSIGQFNIYFECLEIDSVLEYLDLLHQERHVRSEMIEYLRRHHPIFVDGLEKSSLYRKDDNNNTVRMHTYESFRVADYYRQLYENRGHRQLYWVEREPASA